jgi:uncharacterized protein (TIGR00369 family)
MTHLAFEHSLELRVAEKHSDGVTVELPVKPGFMNSTGVMHGGMIASIADETAWEAIVHVLGRRREMTTTELKVNYLLPVTGSTVRARGRVVKAGRTLCVSQVDVFNDAGKLCAIGIVTYILLDRP